mgnify:CR=1 FL=1
MVFIKKIFFKINRKILKSILFISPSRYKLLFYFYIYYFDENKEKELFQLDQLVLKKGNAIDIGCNKGLYSYALSKQKKISKVYSFEPNKYILKDLIYYKCKKIKIYNFALSDVNKKKQLIIPYYKKYELDGWATLEKNIYLNTNFKEFKRIRIETKKLDNFNFKNISFIKIDVEGHELKLLKGATHIFKTYNPDCLIEVKKGNLLKVKKFFNEINTKYRCIPKEKFLFKFAKENYFFSINKDLQGN